jgi:hypothetical protein
MLYTVELLFIYIHNNTYRYYELNNLGWVIYTWDYEVAEGINDTG